MALSNAERQRRWRQKHAISPAEKVPTLRIKFTPAEYHALEGWGAERRVPLDPAGVVVGIVRDYLARREAASRDSTTSAPHRGVAAVEQPHEHTQRGPAPTARRAHREAESGVSAVSPRFK